MLKIKMMKSTCYKNCIFNVNYPHKFRYQNTRFYSLSSGAFIKTFIAAQKECQFNQPSNYCISTKPTMPNISALTKILICMFTLQISQFLIKVTQT